MTKIVTHLKHGLSNNVPNIVVLHAMGEYILTKHAAQYLSDEGLSAHSLVAPDGTNYRCRNDDEGAYHAKGFNLNSLGIEFLVPGSHDYGSFIEAIKVTDWVPEAEYEAGLNQVKEWLELWNIKKVLRHSDLSPERKVDPGKGFPFERFLHDLGLGW